MPLGDFFELQLFFPTLTSQKDVENQNLILGFRTVTDSFKGLTSSKMFTLKLHTKSENRTLAPCFLPPAAQAHF